MNKYKKMNKEIPKTQVIVVGAGIAGIKTSLDLAKNGISSLILESRDRLGGRLHTIKFGKSNLPIDLGASWFHDCYDNPLLKKYWESNKIDFNFDDGKFTYYNEDGLISDNEKLKPVLEEIKIYLQSLYDKLSIDKDISIKQAIYNYIKEKKWCLTDYQIRHVPQLVRYFELWIGSSWEILSARTIAADTHKGRDAMVLNGYVNVFNSELEELINSTGLESVNEIIDPKSNYFTKSGGCSIKLNSIVYKIQWDSKNKEINVSIKDSITGKIQNFRSDYIVLTVPLSILKLTNLNELGAIEWIPSLPINFKNSLNKISFSSLGKLFFEFPEVFWNLEDDRLFSFANVDEEYYKSTKIDLGSHSSYNFINSRFDKPIELNGKIPNGLDYSILFLNLAKTTKKPIILALIATPLTQYIEKQDLNTIFKVFKPVFARISNLKECKIPKPLSIETSKWSSDPFSRGSYTGVTIGDDYESALEYFINPKEIFENSGRVRFAGEGTTDDGNGCVHAAWETGKREAANISKMINKAKL